MSIKEVYDWYAKEGYLDAIPNGLLTLYNYTNKTVWEGNWNYHTLSARGLVLDQEGKVIARPWPKFFNMNERPEVQMDRLPKETPELSEKYDGSMVVIFFDPYKDCWRAVTRGSWSNKQTDYAYQWLNQNAWKLEKQYTYIFELVAPWNRIVVFYPKEKMILIGIIHTESALDFTYEEVERYAWNFGLEPLAFWRKPVESILIDDPNIVNQEGYVARFSNGLRVKIKYNQYLYLHKILTGLSTIGIWEKLSTGGDFDLSKVPDEFMDWFNNEKCVLLDKFREIEQNAFDVWERKPETSNRKTVALYFRGYKHLSGILFRMLDGKDHRPLIWKMIRPDGKKVFKKDQE